MTKHTPPKASLSPADETLGFWQQHRLSLLLLSAIVIAVLLTILSVYLYTSSGAAQLDLSRPGYRAVSDKVERGADIDQYSSTGPVTDKTIKEFIDSYKKQSDKAKSVDAFSGDPLNPEVLVFGATSEE